MRIVIDVMGGDLAPKAPVEGAILYDRETGGRDQLILIGDKDVVEKELASHRNYQPKNITVFHTSQVVEMDDSPTMAVKQKKDSSMVKGIRLQRDGEADAFVSAGSTGAQMAASLLTLGRVKGVNRPALGTIIPGQDKYTFVIDVGANADCKPVNLFQFGLMGSLFMEYIHGVKEPQVGLLNIGAEKTKGNELMIASHQMLSEQLSNFVGNVEGRELLSSTADVVVTDGFTGNVVLKFAEGLIGVFTSSFKTQVKKNIIHMLGALLARPAFKALRKTFDYEEYGGVPLLGVDGISIICHGSSSAKALKNAIYVAREVGDKNVNKHIEEELRLRGEEWREKRSLQA